MLSVVVLISGTGSNLLSLIEACNNPLYPVRVLAVGSDRPAEGLSHAELYGISTFVLQPERFASRELWAKTLQETISHFEPDLVVLAGFMKVLPKDFVNHFYPKLINLHPSLLPSFKGAHAVRDALAAKVSETGCTIHIVDEGVDTGPIIAQAKVLVSETDTEASLHEKIKQQERLLLVETLKSISDGVIDISSKARV